MQVARPRAHKVAFLKLLPNPPPLQQLTLPHDLIVSHGVTGRVLAASTLAAAAVAAALLEELETGVAQLDSIRFDSIRLDSIRFDSILSLIHI